MIELPPTPAPAERGVYFDAWFPRQHCYHPSLPPRRLRVGDDLRDYKATGLGWAPPRAPRPLRPLVPPPALPPPQPAAPPAADGRRPPRLQGDRPRLVRPRRR